MVASLPAPGVFWDRGIHGTGRAAEAVRNRKQALSLKLLRTGLICLWAKAWAHFTDDRHQLSSGRSAHVPNPHPLPSSCTLLFIHWC